MIIWRACSIILTVGVLVISSGSKLISPHQQMFSIGRELYYGAASAELLLAVLLLTRFRKAGAVGCVILAAAGLLAEWLRPGRPCGCLGTMIVLSAREHVMVAGTMGALAALVWIGCSRRTD